MKKKPTKPKKPAPSTALVPVRDVLQGIDNKLKQLARPAAFQPGPMTYVQAPLPAAMGDGAVISADAPLTDDPNRVDLQLEAITFTPEQNAILDENVPLAELRVKPTGQVYLSHPSYTKWMNRAFGRGQWTLQVIGRPIRGEKGIVMPIVLKILGKRVAFAWGEQDYFEGNREQSFGDAIEACNASALRRCMKRLGIGLELWDKPYLDAYVEEHCVQVKVRNYKGEINEHWRRKADRPLKGELLAGPGYSREPGDETDYEVRRPERDGGQTSVGYRAAAPAPQPPYRPDGRVPTYITEPQVKRLFAICKSAKRSDTEVKAWLLARWNVEHRNQILKSQYDAICKAIENPGDLQ